MEDFDCDIRKIYLSQVACNLMAELTMKNEELTSENKRLKQQLNCDVTKCEITVYKDCEKALSCGSKNGVSCAYLPDGIEGTECASMPCPAVKGCIYCNNKL